MGYTTHMFDFASKKPGLSMAAISVTFSGCEDFECRGILPGLDDGAGIYVCWVDGLADGTAISEDILRPLTESCRTDAPTEKLLLELLERGGVYSSTVRRRTEPCDVVTDLLAGFCCLISDAAALALSFEVRSKATRSISSPSVEKSIKGGKDAFVETLRVNTSLVRRKLRTPELHLAQTVVGRRSGTSVAVMYLEGIAKDGLPEEVLRRIDGIDIDGLLSAGDLEEYIVDSPRSPFPQLLHTERPDTFAMHLLDGRVGILVDGLPLGFVLPGGLAAFMRVPEDSADHFLVASMLTLLRWAALFLSLCLPAAFVAISMYHQEMLPVKLLLSMTAAKQFVPFGVAAEVIAMLLSFELLQEAGLRLPDPVGQTASIIGALIVGQSAVEAKVVSPIAVIVVALAGICGYVMPSRDLGAALRLCRLIFVLAAVLMGIYGLMAALALLILHLSTLESFGAPYTAPFTDREGPGALTGLIKRPNSSDKFRSPHLAGRNKRRQK